MDRPAPSARRAIAAATVGNALEFYDFVIYTFFAIQIGHAFFPAQGSYGSLMLSLATYGVGFVTRPIGGLIIGNYSDRAGRRAGMMLSFTLMGGCVITMALIPTYASIGIAAPILVVLTRMVMGFSLGGEVGPTTAYLLESASPRNRGVITAWQTGSQTIAVLLGGVAGLALSFVLTPAALDSYGWRIAFLAGAVTVPFGLWVRRGLPETLHRAEAAATSFSQAATRLGAAREHGRIIVLGLVVLAYGTISTYVRQYMTTFAQATLHMSSRPAFAVGVANGVAALAGVFYGAWLSDRIGRRPVMLWSNLAALLITYPVFLWIVEAHSPLALLGGIALLSAVSSVTFGTFYAALTESLPKRIRGGAVGTLYAVAVAVFGGTCQFAVTWLIHVTGNAMAPGWYLLVACAAAQVAIQMIPESAPARRA